MARLGEEHQYIRVNSTVSIAESDANVLFDLDFDLGGWDVLWNVVKHDGVISFVHISENSRFVAWVFEDDCWIFCD